MRILFDRCDVRITFVPFYRPEFWVISFKLSDSSKNQYQSKIKAEIIAYDFKLKKEVSKDIKICIHSQTIL